MTSSKCWVCSGKDMEAKEGDWHNFECSKYGEYCVTGTAVEAAAKNKLNKEQRQAALERAKKDPVKRDGKPLVAASHVEENIP